MKKISAALFLSFTLALAACSTSSPEPTATERPTSRPPTETAKAPSPTAEPSVATEEPAAAEPENDGGSVNEVEVDVIDSTYLLQVIELPVGTTVTWHYNGGLPHTVTSDTNLFNSGTLGEGDTFSFTFEEAGTFPYFCRFHGGAGGSGMSGVVIVTDS